MSYTFWLDTPLGGRLAPITAWHSLTVVRTVNNAGVMTLLIPSGGVGWSTLRLDSLIEVWRTGAGW